MESARYRLLASGKGYCYFEIERQTAQGSILRHHARRFPCTGVQEPSSHAISAPRQTRSGCWWAEAACELSLVRNQAWPHRKEHHRQISWDSTLEWFGRARDQYSPRSADIRRGPSRGKERAGRKMNQDMALHNPRAMDEVDVKWFFLERP